MRIACGVALLALSAGAASRPFVGEGNAVITRGTEAEAGRIATEKATGQALMLALGREEPALLTGGREHITSSRVLEQSVDGNILTIKVEVQVEPEALRRAFPRGAAQGVAGQRVLVLATEQLDGAHLGWTDHAFAAQGAGVTSTVKTTMVQVTEDMGACEAAVSEAFRAGGFEVIDPEVLEGKVTARTAAQVMNLSNGEAQKTARVAGAELVVVVTGRASLTTVPEAARAGMVSGQASVVARVVRVKDGRVLGSSSVTGAQLHVDSLTARAMALSSAAGRVAQDLIEKLNSYTPVGEHGK